MLRTLYKVTSVERVLTVLLFPGMKCFCRSAIKIDIRPRPVSIFSDTVLKSGEWPLYTGSTVSCSIVGKFKESWFGFHVEPMPAFCRNLVVSR